MSCDLNRSALHTGGHLRQVRGGDGEESAVARARQRRRRQDNTRAADQQSRCGEGAAASLPSAAFCEGLLWSSMLTLVDAMWAGGAACEGQRGEGRQGSDGRQAAAAPGDGAAVRADCHRQCYTSALPLARNTCLRIACV